MCVKTDCGDILIVHLKSPTATYICCLRNSYLASKILDIFNKLSMFYFFCPTGSVDNMIFAGTNTAAARLKSQQNIGTLFR